MAKILITGSSGFLGSRLALHLGKKHELLLPSHSELNIIREEDVKAYMMEHQPAYVIHCAALSRTPYCEQHPQESHKVNVQGTVRIAKACKLTGARMIFMSSDQVYNGTPLTGALKEEDVLQPVNVYGRHKLEAEQRTQWNLPDSVGLRLTWMYDLPSCPLKNTSNILTNLQEAAMEGSTIQAAIHEMRGVSYVWDVVRNIEMAMDLPGGIYNFGSGNDLCSYDLFKEAAHLMGLKDPESWILSDKERFSDQDRNLTMDCSLLLSYGISFPSSVQGIRKALAIPYRL